MKPSAAFRLFNDREIDGALLMRRTVEYDRYLVPGSLSHPPLDAYFGTEEELTFHLFEDSEHFDTWQKQAGVEPLFVDPLPGYEIVARLDDRLAFLNINPDSADVYHYRNHQLPALKKLAEAIAIETALHDTSRADELFDRLKRYREFRMLYRSGDDGGVQIVLAPDDQGRRLIPLFTAEDSFQVFLDRMVPEIQKEIRNPYVLTHQGDEIFAQLAGIPADGIVFNPVGHTRPRAFAMAFCNVIANHRTED